VLDRLRGGARADLRRAGIACDVKEPFELRLYKRDASTKLGINSYVPRVLPYIYPAAQFAPLIHAPLLCGWLVVFEGCEREARRCTISRDLNQHDPPRPVSTYFPSNTIFTLRL
jgi:hypothetical protein